MKRVLYLLFYLLCISSVFTSCEKPPSLTISTPKTLTFTEQGGSQSITFTANRSWTVSSSDSWCKVSPSSGEKSDGSITVTVTCEPNTTYDPRSTALTIRVEDLTETVAISQETNLGLLVSPTAYDITNDAQTIEVEVRANVNYTVEIDSSGKDWITNSGTRALSTDKITFSIAANESYDSREGKIIIKQAGGSLSETVVVRQSQANGLFISTPKYDLSNEAHTLSVEIKANIQFEVISQADWIKYVDTRALTTSTVVLSIEANESYDNRTGTVLVKQTNGDLSGTITITQKQTDGLFVTPSSFELDNAAQTIEFGVKNNISFDVIIPDDAKEWVSVKSNTATRALEDDMVILALSQNSYYDSRETSITIKQSDGPLAETVKIKQAQTDGLIVGTKEFVVGRDGETIEIQVQTNIDYDVIIPDDDKEWITPVVSAPTRSLENQSVFLKVEENPTYSPRNAQIALMKKDGSLKETIVILQEQTDALFITDETKDFHVSSKGGEVIINVFHNVDFKIDFSIPDWLTVSRTIVDETHTRLVITVSQNQEFTDRDASISLVGGGLSELAHLSQHQVNILTIDQSSFSSAWQGGDMTVSVSRNVDYSLSLPEWIVEKSKTSGKDGSLITETIVFSILENLGKERNGVIVFQWYNEKEERLSQIYVNQQYPAIHVETPGTLESLLPSNKHALSCLAITGNLNALDYLALSDCPILAMIDLSGVFDTTMPASAFANNNAIETVLLPAHLVSIPTKVFKNSSIRSIEFPQSIESIQDEAFANCKQLSGELVFPSSLITIGNYVFSGCTSLTCGITIPDKVTSIGRSAFSTDRFDSYARPRFQGPLVLGKSLTYIGDSAFAYYLYPGELIIPNSLTHIGSADSGTSDSEAIFFASKFSSIVLHDEVIEIGNCVFQACTNIQSIVLPKKLKKLGTQAFYTCINAKGSLIIPDSVEYIGLQTFGSDTSLDGPVLLNDKVSEYYNTFRDCSKITKYYCKRATAPAANDWTFKNCNQRYLGVPVGSKQSYENAPYWKDFMVIEEVDFDSLVF